MAHPNIVKSFENLDYLLFEKTLLEMDLPEVVENLRYVAKEVEKSQPPESKPEVNWFFRGDSTHERIINMFKEMFEDDGHFSPPEPREFNSELKASLDNKDYEKFSQLASTTSDDELWAAYQYYNRAIWLPAKSARLAAKPRHPLLDRFLEDHNDFTNKISMYILTEKNKVSTSE
jgi:hypothetical protein